MLLAIYEFLDYPSLLKLRGADAHDHDWGDSRKPVGVPLELMSRSASLKLTAQENNHLAFPALGGGCCFGQGDRENAYLPVGVEPDIPGRSWVGLITIHVELARKL